ncbi:unnamed protein product [Lactuca saligna]|uniref:SWIM-type domain-containing protein n=1 Tax=Lactuca saligna TaxID=75948 RepID=A0AA36A1Q3_LACSI|nr:unnamed protein product [Lactuca saligna]
MEGVLDFDTIDVELDEDLLKKQSRRCRDEFLNSLSLDDEDEDFIIPLFENVEDDEAPVEEEPLDDEQEEEENVDEVVDEEENDSEAQFKYSTHDPNVKWNRMKPQEGERYESPQQLKLCLTNHAISKASWMSTEKSFQIKKMYPHHTCVKNFNNGKLMGPTWLARQFLKELIRTPNLKAKEIQEKVQHKFHTKISWVRSYRARCRAMSMIEGKLGDHYARVWDYGGELLRSNPDSTIKICVEDNNDGTTIFKRMYICFKSIKEGWKMGCRRVVGIDGSFLKGQCKGQLLTAIGRDPNNHVFPIAWAVVEIENKFNWKWFLQLLEVDLGMDAGRGMCVISDQHKGLLEATKEVLPYVEHRQCARHIYANFRKVYSGIQLRNLFWKAAKSTVEGEFKNHMDEIRQISPGAYEHLMAREPNTWCRAFFSTGLACEAVENGMAECFNAVILDARKKPLLTMLEEIRLYMMDRFYNLRELAEKWEGDVCPSAIKKMEEFGEDLKFWRVHPSGQNEFEVRNGLESYGVNIEKRSCACRLWDVSGIPCVHAQASIMLTHQDPKTFISKWFGKAMYISSYSYNILPVNGSNLWTEAPYIKPLPPLERRMPGRPTVKRKRHVSERDDKFSQVSSKGRTVQCQNCQQKGHNKKTCKNPHVEPDPKPNKKIGRPRLDPSLTQWTRRGRGGTRGNRGGGRVPRGGGGFHSWFERGETSNTVPPQKRVNEEYNSEEMVDVDVMSDGDGLDMADMDYITQQITELRKSGYTDVDIMRCLGITKAHLEEFGYVAANVEGGLEGDGQGNEEEGGHGQGDGVEGGGDGQEGEGDGEKEDGEGDEGDGQEEDEEGVPVNDPVQQGHFGNNMKQRTRRPSERIILQKLKKKVVDPLGIGMCEDKALVID